ncbi:hypothetical protein CAEBREN_11964 [Caenorhabditis brenneri]|uniref:glucuronosyltransferase n=1 Tax=Caenorhabditis brenneri TaxID=135651 RepID=G0NPD1_CAEBE|nr:hypothetical protein CAEBREN_11964 [Caenorhabditis brenneri]
MILKHFIPLIIFLIPTITTYNILVYSPSIGSSHTNFMARIADTLTDAGHDVTFLVPIVGEAKIDHLGVKSTKDVVTVELDHKIEEKPADADVKQYWRAEIDSENVKTLFTSFGDSLIRSCQRFLQRKDIFEEMKSRNFDVGIFEPLTICGVGFMHALGIRKTIIASSCVFLDPVLEAMGEPLDYSQVPGLLAKFDGDMTFWDKVENYKLSMAYQEWTWKIFDEESKMHKKFLGDSIPDWRELVSSSSLHFTNSIPYVNFPRTVTQKTIPIGGIQVDFDGIKSEKLADDWEEVLEKRTKNVLISFGSAMRSMDLPEEWRAGLLGAIKSQPNTTFIWKYESDDVSFAAGVSNIHFSKWVPQTSLLNDPRLTAFITHGGLGSTNELSHLGVPAIMIPVAADQTRNSNMLARHGGVIVLRKQDLGDPAKIEKAVKDILFDENYGENSKKLADLLRNQPLKPKEQVVRYVEFVAQFGPFPKMDLGGQGNFLSIYFVIYLPYLIFVLLFVLVLIRSLCSIKRTKEKMN